MKSQLERVRELRESGYGIEEAKRIVRKQDLNEEIARAKTINDIKAILFSLVR
ncbi:hypothetical protein [Rhizobium sp. 12,4]|uniref:hypothetical protein n=1 Tax=Rhizobium sp. 12,4 TaxID=3405135 RepID=UPI003D33CC70